MSSLHARKFFAVFSLIALIGARAPLASAQDLEDDVPSVPIEKPEPTPIDQRDPLPSLGSIPSATEPPAPPAAPLATPPPNLYSYMEGSQPERNDDTLQVGGPEYKFRGSLGFAHVSGEGGGPGGEVRVRANALEIDAGLQATVDGKGTAHLPQLDLAVGVRDDAGSIHLGEYRLSYAPYAKLAFDRNTALDREGGGRIQGGATWKARAPGGSFEFDASLAAGGRDSGSDAIFYLEERNRLAVEFCALPSANDKLCADVWGDLAIGFIQAEAAGGVGLSYQRMINGNSGKVFIRAGAEATATADFAGTHSYSKVGLTAGGAL